MDDKTMLEKVPMNTKTLKVSALRRNAGFTAIEIAMVAAVIAILSLIILPVFRSKVEEAKIAAAQADLAALMKAEQVVKADIDAYARLEDLDNVELFGYTANPTGGIDKEVPAFQYVAPDLTLTTPDPGSRQYLTPLQRATLAGSPNMSKWKGPYIAFQRSIKYEDLQNIAISQVGQYILRSVTGDAFSAIQDGHPTPDLDSHINSRIPVDPWGNPYLFFPPTGNSANPNGISGGASPSAVIYSLGPNGGPGDGTGSGLAQNYTREYAITSNGAADSLGQDDDLKVEF